MKGMLPIPKGLQLPKDATTKPFTMQGKFLLHGDHLMAIELNGLPVAEPEMEDEYEESEEDEEYGEGKSEGGEMEEGGCCGEYKKGKMCPDCPKQAGGFLVAVERAMKPRNGG